MGLAKLPKSPKEQAQWARRLAVGTTPPPYPLLRQGRESIGQAYRRIFFLAFEIGAQAGLQEALAELDRPDDPCAGLPEHLRKSAAAGAAGHARRAANKAQGEERG